MSNETKAREPMWINCNVDCDEDYFHLDVVEIEGEYQGQEWDNSMQIEFIEYSAYRDLEAKLAEAQDKLAKAVACLQFYSIKAKYDPVRWNEVGSIIHDDGNRARQTLKEIGE
jgi:hypothetical protein